MSRVANGTEYIYVNGDLQPSGTTVYHIVDDEPDYIDLFAEAQQ